MCSFVYSFIIHSFNQQVFIEHHYCMSFTVLDTDNRIVTEQQGFPFSFWSGKTQSKQIINIPYAVGWKLLCIKTRRDESEVGF